MKVFAFVTKDIDPKTDMCFNDRKSLVYEIKKNVPKLIGYSSYYKESCKDDEAKVFDLLVSGGFIPKKIHHSDLGRKGYKIINLNQYALTV